MNVYNYDNYDEYVKSQKAAFKKKFSNIWAKEENIKAICDHIRQYKPTSGLCHGTRQGYEQAWFTKHLDNCHVIGSEIGSDDAPATYQWDFNKGNENWIDRFDFIYSNSFDHTYDPEQTFNVWVEQVRKAGLLIFEYDRRQEHTGDISKKWNKTDPVSLPADEFVILAPRWNNRVIRHEIIDMPIVTQQWRKAIIFYVD